MTSNDNDHRGLLPAGLADLLPPDAAREARAIDVAIERFAAFGYERVKPPLVEFEESLLGGPGAALGPQTFRLMDPVSQRMMGVRPDMTVQVARIAVTRLKHEPRPLRLSYGGNVIRVRGSALKPERQFAQVGTELIGVDTAEADAEAVLLAVDALRAIGVADLTVDLNLPTLVAAVAAGLKLAGRARCAACAARSTARTRPPSPRRWCEGDKKARRPVRRPAARRRPGRDAASRSSSKLKLPAAGAAEAARLAEVVKLVARRRPRSAAHPRSGRISRPRIPDRRVLLGVRAEGPPGAGARRALFGGLSRGRRQRARDRLHALHGCRAGRLGAARRSGRASIVPLGTPWREAAALAGQGLRRRARRRRRRRRRAPKPSACAAATR